jgi:hypothetical protein
MAVALSITAALVLGTLGAVAPATAAPVTTSALTGKVPLPAAATAAAPSAIAPIPGPPSTPAKTALSGTVTAHTTTGTKPLAGVSVRVFNAAGTQYGFTDQNGKYSVAGLAAGSYKVAYDSYSTSSGFDFVSQYYKGKATEAEATPIKVGTTSLTGYDVTMQQGSAISGTLTSKIGTKQAPALSVRQVTTYLNGSKTGVVRYLNVDAQGRYKITKLPAGTYKLSFGNVGADIGLRGEFYNNATTLAASKSIVVGFAKTVTGINAELAGKPDMMLGTGVMGSTNVGSTLTGNVYASPAATTTTYQWYRNGVAISGATKVSYVLVGADAGKSITLTVKVSRTGYTGATSSAPAWNTISPGVFSASPPKLSGTVKVGATLTVKPGTIAPAPTKRAYAWYRNGVAIKGATAVTYKLGALDKGATISVRETATSLGYTTSTQRSTSTVAVP